MWHLFFSENREKFPSSAMLHEFKKSDVYDVDERLHDAWLFFASEVLPRIKPGRFNHFKAMRHGQMNRVYTVSDEAFVMWVLDVYSPKWDRLMSLNESQRSLLKCAKGRSTLGVPQLSKEEHKKFREWYGVVKEGRASIHLQGWIDVLAGEGNDYAEGDALGESAGDCAEAQYDSEEEDYPIDSIEMMAV